MIIIMILISLLIILLTIFTLKYKNNIENLDLLNEEINESLKSISIAVEKKENYLESTIDIIKNSNKRKYSKKEILGDLIKNKNKKLSLNEKINELENNLYEFKNIIDDDKKLSENKRLNEIIYELNTNDNDLNASIKFYNDVIKDIKKKKKNVLNNFIWKKKEYEDHDEIVVNKKEEFEILKEGN